MNISYKFQQGLFEDSWQIRKEVFMDEQGFYDEFEDKDKICYHLVIYIDNISVGNARLELNENNVGHLGRFAIKKNYRKQGIGKILIKELEKEAYKLGIKEIYLNAQYDKVGFYEKCGYTKTNKPQFLDEGYPHNEMYKKIAI